MNIWRCCIYQPIISALLHRGGERSQRSSAPVSDVTTERNLAQTSRRGFLRLQLCVLCGQLSRNNRSPPLKRFECLLSTLRLLTILLQVLLQDYNVYLRLIAGDEWADAKCVSTTIYSQWEPIYSEFKLKTIYSLFYSTVCRVVHFYIYISNIANLVLWKNMII